MSCKRCNFFEPIGDGHGECRWLPPARPQSLLVKKDEPNRPHNGYWPVVKDSDWCGSFEMGIVSRCVGIGGDLCQSEYGENAPEYWFTHLSVKHAVAVSKGWRKKDPGDLFLRVEVSTGGVYTFRYDSEVDLDEDLEVLTNSMCRQRPSTPDPESSD